MLDYCPKRGKQNSQHKAHARRATRTRAPTAKRRTPTPHGRNQPLGYTPQCRPQHAHTRTVFNRFASPLVPVARLELARPTGHPLLRRACLPFHHTGKTRGERKQTRATTTRPQCAQPAGHTHTSRTIGQPNPRARTLSTGPPRPAPTYSPTPRAPWRKHPSATRTHPAHHQCRHTPLRDSTHSREHPRIVSAPRSA